MLFHAAHQAMGGEVLSWQHVAIAAISTVQALVTLWIASEVRKARKRK